MSDNLGEALEAVGQAWYDYNEEPDELVESFLTLARKTYVLVPFPQVQEYMEKDWFESEASLEVDGKINGNGAYFIPLNRIL